MAALLSKAGKDLTVTVLLDALQQTKDFENSMARKFAVSVSGRFHCALNYKLTESGGSSMKYSKHR